MGSMDLLQDGGRYHIQGPKNMSLTRDTTFNFPMIGFIGPVEDWSIWEAKAMANHAGVMSGFYLINRDPSAKKVWCLAAANPNRPGEPMMPPDQGSQVTLVDIQQADDYAIWTPNKTSGPNRELSLTNLMSFGYSTSAPSLVLNVPGNFDDWKQGSKPIVWPWSGGEKNEIWWFQPI